MTIKQLMIILPSAIATILPNTANCAIGGIGDGGKDPGLTPVASCTEVTCTTQIINSATATISVNAYSCATSFMNKCYKNQDGKYFVLPYCSSCASGYTLDTYNYPNCKDANKSPFKVCFKSCNIGYYNPRNTSTSDCIQCPEWSRVYTNSARTTLARGTTKTTNATAITECYVAAGTYYDVTGTFKISSNCEYE